MTIMENKQNLFIYLTLVGTSSKPMMSYELKSQIDSAYLWLQ